MEAKEKIVIINKLFGIKVPEVLDPQNTVVTLLSSDEQRSVRLTLSDALEKKFSGMETGKAISEALRQGDIVPAYLENQKPGDAVVVTYFGGKKQGGGAEMITDLFTLKEDQGWTSVSKKALKSFSVSHGPTFEQ